jgi:hypothetical protein
VLTSLRKAFSTILMPNSQNLTLTSSNGTRTSSPSNWCACLIEQAPPGDADYWHYLVQTEVTSPERWVQQLFVFKEVFIRAKDDKDFGRNLAQSDGAFYRWLTYTVIPPHSSYTLMANTLATILVGWSALLIRADLLTM